MGYCGHGVGQRFQSARQIVAHCFAGVFEGAFDRAALDERLDADLDVSPDADLGVSLDADLGASPDADLGGSPDVDLGASPDVDLGVSPDADLGVSLDADLGVSLDADLGVNPDADLGVNLRVVLNVNSVGSHRRSNQRFDRVVLFAWCVFYCCYAGCARLFQQIALEIHVAQFLRCSR